MGGCASVPKGMKEEATAPPPEPAKEETPIEVAEVPAEAEKKVDENASAEEAPEEPSTTGNAEEPKAEATEAVPAAEEPTKEDTTVAEESKKE